MTDELERAQKTHRAQQGDALRYVFPGRMTDELERAQKAHSAPKQETALRSRAAARKGKIKNEGVNLIQPPVRSRVDFVLLRFEGDERLLQVGLACIHNLFDRGALLGGDELRLVDFGEQVDDGVVLPLTCCRGSRLRAADPCVQVQDRHGVRDDFRLLRG